MATGSVNIIQVNSNQGNFNQVERVFLFIGESAEVTTMHDILAIGADSDLDALLGMADSELKTQISAAIVNSKNPNFACYAIGIDFAVDDWKEVLYAALEHPSDLNVEAVVLCHPVVNKSEVEACQVAAVECLVRFAKFITIHAAVAGIDPATQSWSEYMIAINALVDNVVADRVSLVPLLHGNNLGVVAGRLCNSTVTIADTPMRVATGGLVGLGEAPVDSADAPLNSTHINTFSQNRFSVPQWYTGYDGMYWADHMLLDAESGDFQVYEYMRVIDYLARRVRILAIARIADRRLNSTAQSISANETYFTRPVREASIGIELAGQQFPGLVKDPDADAIVITWTTQTTVSIAITAQPYKCPKKISLYLGLDLSN